MLFAPSGKGRKRQKKGEKGRFRPISRKGGQTPLKPPFVTPPFVAAQPHRSLSRLSGPSVSGLCLTECPRKSGCLTEGCTPGPSGMRSGVSTKRAQSVPDTPGTLQGHSRDTFRTLRSAGPGGPRGHPPPLVGGGGQNRSIWHFRVLSPV